MSKYIKEIKLNNFRIYEYIALNPNKKMNFIIGNNGVGKTTILESIHFCSVSKSHKTENLTELIKNGFEYARISLVTEDKDDTYTIDNIISKQGKRAKINKNEYKKLSDYIGFLKVVMFSPEDFMLLNGTPSQRRRFLDIEIGKFSKQYIKNLIQYKKILKNRNELLKQLDIDSDVTLLNVINKQIAVLGSRIIEERVKFINDLNQITTTKLNDFYTIKDINYFYNGSIKETEHYYEEIVSKNKNDIITKTTSVGPHRDDIEFTIGHKNARGYASQGQQRSMLVGLKFTLSELIFNKTGSYPILLLDDVFSELDNVHKKKIINYAINKAQTFITTTDLKEMYLESFSENDYKIIKL